MENPENLYTVEFVADSSLQWCGNQIAYRTVVDANTAGSDRAMVWTAVRAMRVVNIRTGAVLSYRSYVSDDDGINPDGPSSRDLGSVDWTVREVSE